MARIKDLKPNKKNPRKIAKKDLDRLKVQMTKFGDLSGFVMNNRTGTLISGHQRAKAIPAESQIKIEIKHPKPTAANTVAEGYVVFGDERVKYREVDADIEWEMEALLAANNNAGSWDRDLLKVLAADMPKLDWDMTGMSMEDMPPMPKIQTDEQYVRGTEQTTERIDTEGEVLNAPMRHEESGEVDSSNAFENVEQKKMDVTGRRFIIIIDCKSEEEKQSLRELLRPTVDEAGAKFF